MESYKCTHRLKKDWRYPGNHKEIFRKGTPVILLGGNAVMLDKNGHTRKIGDLRVPGYSLDFFSPQNEWLLKIE